MELTTQQIIAGVAGAAAGVATALQVVPDPAPAVEAVALVCTVIAAGANGFLVAVSSPVRMGVQLVSKHFPSTQKAARLEGAKLSFTPGVGE